MAKTNDQVLLEALVNESRSDWGDQIPDFKLFELFTADLVLKNNSLEAMQIQSGNIGQGLDGQIDSFFIFADGELIEDVDAVADARKNLEIEVFVIQSKTTSSSTPRQSKKSRPR